MCKKIINYFSPDFLGGLIFGFMLAALISCIGYAIYELVGTM